MKSSRDPNKPFAFAHRYAAVSLVAVLITAIALAALYRELSIRTIVKFGEKSNLTVAKTTLNAMLREFAAYLRAEELVVAIGATDAVPVGLLSLVRAAVRDTPIERIKIYNRNGILLYSTLEYEIGTNDSANAGFQESIRGTARSNLRYEDAFNLFGRHADDPNLIETYVPIRQPGEPRPIGVLEIYTDVNPIVRAMTSNELLILAGIVAIMSILYSVLLFVVRRAEAIIANQRQTIVERTETLEMLSARMLDTEETERRRVARELHEEVVQTLSAVKIKIEALAGTGGGAIVPLIQATIRDIRALAMDLRPPALDDFGLIATTRSLCHEAEQVQGPSGITADITAREEDVPDPLKSVIFRIVQQTLKRLVGTPGISDIRVSLAREEKLQLTIAFRTESGEASTSDGRASSPEKRPMTDFWERAVLAGGSFSVADMDAGRSLYQATWTL